MSIDEWLEINRLLISNAVKNKNIIEVLRLVDKRVEKVVDVIYKKHAEEKIESASCAYDCIMAEYKRIKGEDQ